MIADSRASLDQAYALWAATYDSDPNPILALEGRHLRPMLPCLAGKTLLDLGSGTGRLLNLLSSKQQTRYLGVDLSSAMLERAAKKVGACDRLVRADCLNLPLPDRIAEVVICSFLLGYVSLNDLAAEIARVSKVNSEVYLSEFHPDTRSLGWRRCFRVGNELIELPTRSYSVEDVVEAFQYHGFDLAQSVEPTFGEPERKILVSHKKDTIFDSSRGTAAIFICHLRRARGHA